MRPLGRQPALLGMLVLAVAVALATWNVGHGQQFLFGGPPVVELTAPQIDVISGTTQARLEQAETLAADGQWYEAVDILRELAADDGGKVVALDEGSYVSLPTYCQLQLSRLPPEGLAAYRRQVDTVAEQRFRGALAARDPAQLASIIDELFCSSWGDDALAAAGELALERGDYAAARRAWHAISPLVCDPQGRSTWFALYDIDLSHEWSKINTRWQDRTTPPTWLAYPDTLLDLADVRARLVLVSIREGDFDRAALELDVFRRLHPQAAGRLAGQQGPYAPALERLLKSARDWPAAASDSDWPTFARVPTRNADAQPLDALVSPLWPDAVPLGTGSPAKLAQPVVRESASPLSWHPVIVGGRVYYCDARSIHAVDWATGKLAIAADGMLHRLDVRTSDGRLSSDSGSSTVAGVPQYTMTVAGNTLYARLGANATGRLQAGSTRTDERLVGIDLSREGLLTFQVKPDDGTWSFDGAPVGDGRRVYVAMRHSDVRPGVYVAAFDAATGRRMWRTFLGAADTPAAGRGDEITHNLLTLVGDRIFANTNLGIVAALAADDGRIAWLRRYDRAAGKFPLPGPTHFDRDPSPCVYYRGLVFAAPADTPQVFALDADTGQTVWANERLTGIVHLVGAAHGRLIASGNQFWALDARSGRVRFAWPDSEHAGIRGFGRGLVAGRESFWPSRDRIYVFDITTGQQSRTPIDITSYTTVGANLVAADGRLLVVGQDRMMAIGPRDKPKPQQGESEAVDAVAMIH